MNNKDRKQIKEALEDSKKGAKECSDADNFTTKMQNENNYKNNKRKKKRQLLFGRQQTRRSERSKTSC